MANGKWQMAKRDADVFREISGRLQSSQYLQCDFLEAGKTRNFEKI
jgi:hypothetical protein